MDLDALPDDPLERLAGYQAARRLDEERELIAGIRLKIDAGIEPTEREWICYSYSIFGSASTCGY